MSDSFHIPSQQEKLDWYSKCKERDHYNDLNDEYKSKYATIMESSFKSEFISHMKDEYEYDNMTDEEKSRFDKACDSVYDETYKDSKLDELPVDDGTDDETDPDVSSETEEAEMSIGNDYYDRGRYSIDENDQADEHEISRHR